MRSGQRLAGAGALQIARVALRIWLGAWVPCRSAGVPWLWEHRSDSRAIVLLPRSRQQLTLRRPLIVVER